MRGRGDGVMEDGRRSRRCQSDSAGERKWGKNTVEGKRISIGMECGLKKIMMAYGTESISDGLDYGGQQINRHTQHRQQS